MTEELQPLLSPIPQLPDLTEHDNVSKPVKDVKFIIFALFTGSYLAALDTTIVTTLLPTIASELDASNQMSWIVTSYLLSCSAFQPLYGKLSDVFGRKAILLWSNLCFGFGCVLCGAPFTNSLKMLCLGRFIAGVGGGGLNTLSTITTSDIIPLRQRGVYQGMGNIVFALGCASGSLIGAFLQQRIGWRWAFLCQAPLSLVSCFLIITFLNLPEDSPGRGLIHLSKTKITFKDIKKHVDYTGSFTLISTMLLLMTILSLLDKPSQLSPTTWALFMVGLVFSGYAFVTAELGNDNPMVPLRLLGSNRTVLASSLTNWFSTMSIFAITYYVPVFWQTVYHLKPWEIGVRTISNFIAIASGSMLTGIYMKRTGKYKAYSNTLNSVAVIGTLIVFSSTFNSEMKGVLEYVMLFLPGLGYAAMLTITLLSLIASVDAKHQAQVTSIQYAFRAIGSTLGVSFAGLIYQTKLQSSLLHTVVESEALNELYSSHQLRKWSQTILENNSYDVSFDPLLQSLVKCCFQKSSQLVLGFAVITCVLGLVSGLFIREHVLHTDIQRN
ncbi:unnamed protein product [Kluyveromyces dobzhanskii CBS 2104]|uniref:WGS project CCBQ000000000 data, contig 00058 n=1 Tax=Kluyveromyces dobzhanskii CBS 2104 TaxID=1427455 RepID=A0A0A8LD66_9SACH|nr:unnamed protein product [Kluyveromyces dobzhanskii CBS 2104]